MKIFEKAIQVNFRTIDELAAVYCEYTEMELRNHNFEEAHKYESHTTVDHILNFCRVMLRGTVSPRRGAMVTINENEPVQKRLFKSVKMWTMLAGIQLTPTSRFLLLLFDLCRS